MVRPTSHALAGTALLLSFLLPARLGPVGSGGVSAQIISNGEGGAPAGPLSSPESAGYECDPSSCRLPDCLCASASPPGGLAPQDTPQFITFTADDAIQVYTRDAVNHFLAQRRNPNGCAPKMTYFTSLSYTNYSMVTDWFVEGNEIADHTMTHVGTPNSSEILGNLKALNAFSGIPLSSITGFRAPLLDFSSDTLTQLHEAGFTYDSSMTAATAANVSSTDSFWPYTLDEGIANNCLERDICRGQLKLPGLWEIPMHAIFEPNDPTKIHLMDPWLDSTDMNAVLGWLQHTFLSHYNGNRQPFGLYTHPIHLATGYPGVPDPIAMRNMLNTFLDWAQTYSDVWIVSNQQMLEWVRNPSTNANIAQTAALGCSRPSVDPGLKICNGVESNQLGLLNQCPFTDFPWTTCYGCPTTSPTPNNPTPPQNVTIGGVRYRLPSNCSTAFFDPIGNTCLCDSSDCAFTDDTRPIGNYTTGLGGGQEQDGTSSKGSAPSSTRNAASKATVTGTKLSGAVGVRVGAALALVGLGVGLVL